MNFKMSMLRTSLCDYSDAYTLVSGTITITGAGNNDAARQLDERNKWVILKNYTSFTECIGEKNNTQIDHAKYIDVVMPMYNLIEYIDNYSKTSGSLRQYYKDDPNDTMPRSGSFKYKIKITGKTPANGKTIVAKISVPLNTSVIFGELLKCH